MTSLLAPVLLFTPPAALAQDDELTEAFVDWDDPKSTHHAALAL